MVLLYQLRALSLAICYIGPLNVSPKCLSFSSTILDQNLLYRYSFSNTDPFFWVCWSWLSVSPVCNLKSTMIADCRYGLVAILLNSQGDENQSCHLKDIRNDCGLLIFTRNKELPSLVFSTTGIWSLNSLLKLLK